MATNVGGFVFTNLDTPTPWISTVAADQEPHWPDGLGSDPATVLAADSPKSESDDATSGKPFADTESLKAPTTVYIDMTATQTYSIVKDNLVLATFTVVGTETSPPRGVPMGMGVLSSEGMLLIAVITGITMFIFGLGFVYAKGYVPKAAKADFDHASEPSRGEGGYVSHFDGRFAVEDDDDDDELQAANSDPHNEPKNDIEESDGSASVVAMFPTPVGDTNDDVDVDNDPGYTEEVGTAVPVPMAGTPVVTAISVLGGGLRNDCEFGEVEDTNAEDRPVETIS
ncbi:hypothetical protein Dda_4187 [Drechslerella dactyloides]|uniref:Transmembrane protein n=1 Tax=Drechslerella dactyloides TaxID=74499 RepID=A0AAD6NKI2_DREDA|nr:hypothetical protein Dda_4187 [Drechslerella dactyloides]